MYSLICRQIMFEKNLNLQNSEDQRRAYDYSRRTGSTFGGGRGMRRGQNSRARGGFRPFHFDMEDILASFSAFEDDFFGGGVSKHTSYFLYEKLPKELKLCSWNDGN